MRRRIHKLRIHPAVGIARVGRSPEGFFIGPEIPGVAPAPPRTADAPAGFRDRKGHLKRQAARFRVFAYDKSDRLIGEVTGREAKIVWTVHLRNTKAAGRRFDGLKRRTPPRNPRWRDRRSLVLDPAPSPARVQGAGARLDLLCFQFMKRAFQQPLKLGTLRTDAFGRLLVLGGHGHAGTLTDAALDAGDNNYANRDGWYDDVSDGPVDAVVTLKDGRRLSAMTAWVIVAPPKFAPEVQSVVTLYDTLYQLALDSRHLRPELKKRNLLPRARPSFTDDIYPILRRAADAQWLFARAGVGHYHQLSVEQARHDEAYRRHVFRQFRCPDRSTTDTATNATGQMPYLWSDRYPVDVTQTLTRHQYDVMKAWADGNFVDDWTARSRRTPTRVSPAGLDQAALETCVGAAFVPGIEVSWKVRDVFRYHEPFRLDPVRLRPGDVTQQMAIPWQSDFVDCSDGDTPYVWWPSHRPVDVIRASEPLDGPQFVRWARPFSKRDRDDIGVEAMIRDGDQLGLIKRAGRRLVEYDRRD